MQMYRDEKLASRIEAATSKKSPKADKKRGAMKNVNAANSPTKTFKGLLNECAPAKKKK